MIGSALPVVVAAALLTVAALRIPNWRSRYASRPMTVALAALGLATLLRTQSLGDRIIDGFITEHTGLANVPDVAGHVLSVIAAACIAAHVLIACKQPPRAITIAFGSAAVACVALIGLWFAHGSDEQALNMVQLPGMRIYSIVFAVAFGISQALMLYASNRALSAGCNQAMVVNFLRVAACFGLAFSLHRIVVAAAPSTADFHYTPIAWTLALGTLVFYAAAALGSRLALREVSTAT